MVCGLGKSVVEAALAPTRNVDARTFARWLLAGFLLVAGFGHFIAAEEFLAQVPSWLPWPEAVVAISGVLELALGAALLLRPGPAAGWLTAGFFVLIFPGNIAQFVEGMAYEEFAADDKTAFAVVRALEMIGEAAKHVPDEMRLKYPDVPWRAVVGTRDMLIHAYFGVDLEVVWRTVTQDLKPLRDTVRRIIDDLDEESSQQ